MDENEKNKNNQKVKKRSSIWQFLIKGLRFLTTGRFNSLVSEPISRVDELRAGIRLNEGFLDDERKKVKSENENTDALEKLETSADLANKTQLEKGKDDITKRRVSVLDLEVDEQGVKNYYENESKEEEVTLDSFMTKLKAEPGTRAAIPSVLLDAPLENQKGTRAAIPSVLLDAPPLESFKRPINRNEEKPAKRRGVRISAGKLQSLNQNKIR